MKHLKIETQGGVVTCRMSNPPRHTLVAPEVAELMEMLRAAEADPEVRVLVLTGAEDGVFIAHYEVGELADSSEKRRTDGPPAAAPGLHAMHRLCLALESSRLVTIAAVNGAAAGGGWELALACDFRLLMDGDFRLGLPETNVGIIPGAGGTQRYQRLLGAARTIELILLGRLLSPAEALALGLATAVYPAAGFHAEVRTFAETLSRRAPIALAAAKRAIRDGAGLPLPDALSLEQRQFETCMASEDAATAMRSWLQGRTWEWKGR